MDLCFELATQIMAALSEAVSPVDEVHGFRYFDDRDLIGFVDGTENPAGQAAINAAYVGSEDAAFAGGSYVIVQKYLHDIAGWNALSTEAQERIIGRAKLSDIELDDAIKPTSAHNALTTIVEGGKEIKIIRDNMPFGRVADKEFGTYFIGYARSPRTIELMLENMFIGRPPAIVCSISVSPSPAVCSLCRPRLSWTTSPTTFRRPNKRCRIRRPRRHSLLRKAMVRSVSVPSKETPPHE